jgi:putative phosphoribosyl transferase
MRLELDAGPGVHLEGDREGPIDAAGIVVFAHGSGSSRFSPRNRHVAERLRAAGLQTLLFDLLTDDEEAAEEAGGMRRFDIDLLAGRLVAVVDRCRAGLTPGQRIGLFGASTGAGAALVAAAARPDVVGAVVSRGGRPDLAGDALGRVTVPTLLIVGELDPVVIELNREAAGRLRASTMVIVPGATHLFEEPGTLDRVAQLAADWFARHLAADHLGLDR